MPAAKKSRGGNVPTGDTEMQIGWAKEMPNEERMDHGESWIRGEDPPELSGESGGWNFFLNFGTTTEFVHKQYSREAMRGVHFYTATVQYLRENPKMSAWDTTGHGTKL